MIKLIRGLMILALAVGLLYIGVLIGKGSLLMSGPLSADQDTELDWQADSGVDDLADEGIIGNDSEDGRAREGVTQNNGQRRVLNIAANVARIVAMPTQFKQFAAAYPLALKATEAQLEAIIETLMRMESNPASIGIARIFYVRYVNLNPSAAINHFWLTVSPESTQYRRVMFNIYHEWAWIDMDATLADITQQVPQQAREDLITYLVTDDHFTRNQNLLTLAQNFSTRTRTAILMAAADRESFADAFDRFANMEGDLEVSRQGLFSVVRRWASQDPAAAIARIAQMPTSRDKNTLMGSVISVWAEEDPESALIAALNMPEGAEHALSVLGILARKDGAQALALAELHQQSLDSSAMNHIMQSWAMADPRAAANYLEGRGGKNIHQDASRIVWHYTMRYPEEAYQWAERMGLMNDANVASNMGNALVQADLSKAEALFSNLGNGASRRGLFTSIVRKRSQIDIEGTYKWLSGYKNESGYQDARNNLFYEWGRRDPQQAAQAILSVDDNPNRTSHVYSVAGHWYDKSPEAALSWVYGIADGNLRDGTIASIVQKVGRFDVNEATMIATEINNEQLRQQVLAQIAQHQ